LEGKSKMVIPDWLATYQRKNLGSDLSAGVIVAVLVMPQSLAYALLAGLPPQAGLYASILPVLVYAWLGSSMRQAVGPVAITAIMTYSVLSPLAAPGSAQYVGLAAVLALYCGVLTLVFGVARLGFLSQLLSRPVVSGFISGSALLIVISQIPLLLGVSAEGSNSWQSLESLALHWGQAHGMTLVLASTALAALLASRYLLVPVALRCGFAADQAQVAARVMPLLVVSLATLAVVRFDLDGRAGVAVVGHVSAAAALWQWVTPTASTLALLTTPALILAFIGAVQNITMAQALAAKRRERVDPNQELIGLGAGNVLAAFSGGMPVGGGLSRSAVNVMAGAQTPLASIVTALTTLVIVLLGTDWLARMPLAVLAASIVVAAISMVDVQAFRQAWAYDRADALALLGTSAGVLLAGIQVGIALGIGLSLVALLVRASAPHIAVIGRIPGSEHFRNVERHGVQTLAGALFLRIDESLFFGNLNAVELRLTAELAKDARIQHVVLIMSAVNRVDTTAMEMLTDLNRDLGERGIRLHLAEVKGPVQDRLLRSPLWAGLSGEVHQSVNAAFEAIASNASNEHPPEFHI
jgi:SulP family sulfate permease